MWDKHLPALEQTDGHEHAIAREQFSSHHDNEEQADRKHERHAQPRDDHCTATTNHATCISSTMTRATRSGMWAATGRAGRTSATHDDACCAHSTCNHDRKPSADANVAVGDTHSHNNCCLTIVFVVFKDKRHGRAHASTRALGPPPSVAFASLHWHWHCRTNRQ